MSVMLELRPRWPWQCLAPTMADIAQMRDLSYGVMDANAVLDQWSLGEKGIVFDPEQIGRGIEVTFSRRKVALRLPLPAAWEEIQLFYDLAAEIGTRMGDARMYLEGQRILPEMLEECKRNALYASVDGLRRIHQAIRSGECETMILCSALHPIALGPREVEHIGQSLQLFAELLHRLQQMGVYYPSPNIFRRQDGSQMGLYLLEEDTPTAIPREPRLPFRQVQDVNAWYAYLPDRNMVPYETLRNHVGQGEPFDGERILVRLTDADIRYLAENCAVDPEGNPKKGTYGGRVLDVGSTHIRKIREKQLPLEELAGYSHMAVFLRWMCRKGFLSQTLLEQIPELPALAEDGKTDLRRIIAGHPAFDGMLRPGMFCREGREFSRQFYVFRGGKGYPSCVDQCALDIFGPVKFNSLEFQDEAYLFLPWDEQTRQVLSGYIDRAWQEFQEQGSPVEQTKA